MRLMSALPALGLIVCAAALAHSAPVAKGKKQPAADRKECVVASAVHDQSADADDRLILHVGTRAAISYLPEPCEGLMSINRYGTLGMVTKRGRYCSGDDFTIGGGPMSAVGLDPHNTHCTLGPFEIVAEKALPAEYRR